MPVFVVTFEIWSHAACAAGEPDDRGFVLESAPLREAIAAVKETRTNQVDGVESISASDSDIGAAHCLYIDNGMEFLTGDRETRTLHIPEAVSAHSRRRIARLIGMEAPSPIRDRSAPSLSKMP